MNPADMMALASTYASATGKAPENPLNTCLPEGAPNPIQDPKGYFAVVCKGETQVEETKFLNAPAKQSDKPLFVRLCVLSATDLAAGDLTGKSDPYVEIIYGHESFATEPQSQTLNPVWDHLLEFEIREAGNLKLTIYDKDLGRKGKPLGNTSITIPFSTVKVKREVLQLKNVPAGWFSKAPNSRLTIVWHIVDSLENQPDLVELANRVESTEEEKLPVDLRIEVTLFETSHPKDHEFTASCVQLGFKDRKMISPYGKPDGTKFQYGKKSNGWKTFFFMPQSTLEDRMQARLSLQWLTQILSEKDWKEIEKNFDLEESDVEDSNVKIKPETKINMTDFFKKKEKDPENPEETKNLGINNILDSAKEDVEKQEKERARKRALEKERKKQKKRQKNLKVKTGGKMVESGFWEINVDDLYVFCQDTGVKWAGRAVMMFKGVSVGDALIQVDCSAVSSAHNHPIDLFRYPPPIVKGVESTGHSATSGRVQRKTVQNLFVSFYADFLPVADWNWSLQGGEWTFCDPFIVVDVQGLPEKPNIFSTPVKAKMQREVEWDALAIKIPVGRQRNRILVDIFDSDSPIASMSGLSKTLIGQIRVSSIQMNRPLWHHLYGGAIDAPRGDLDTAMTKGALSPASTYHGSLCMYFDTKRTKQRGWPPIPDVVGVPMTLDMKLFRGLYFPTSYYGKEVDVLVQIAGCCLDVTDHSNPGNFDRGEFRGRRDMKEIPRANFDILAFPGRVNQKGILRFYSWTLPRDEQIRAYHNARSRYEKYGLRKGEPKPVEENDPSNSWVLRSSPPLKILPNVDYAYVYVQLVGQESKQPEIFGRFPLIYPEDFQEQFTASTGLDASWPPPAALQKDKKPSDKEKMKDLWGDKSANDKMENIRRNFRENAAVRKVKSMHKSPKWVELHWDQSVVSLPESRYVNTFAATICGYATLSIDEKWKKQEERKKMRLSHHKRKDGAKNEDSPTTMDDTPTDTKFSKNKYKLKPPKSDIDDPILEFISETEGPLLAEEHYVPTPSFKHQLCGISRTISRKGVPGTIVQFEPLPVGWFLREAVVRGANAWAATEGQWLQMSKNIPFMQRVYCHADILAARSLPAMDDDALLNPYWELYVEDKVVKFMPEHQIEPDLSNLPSSKNPSFLQRTVVPLDLYLPPSVDKLTEKGDGGEIFDRWLEPETYLACPPPPILIRIYDVDPKDKDSDDEVESESEEDDPPEIFEGMNSLDMARNEVIINARKMMKPQKSHVEKQLIGTFVDWDVPNLDIRTIQGLGRLPMETDEVDLNGTLEPVWYSLEDADQALYSEVEGDISRSVNWSRKSRCLAAFGFSNQAPDFRKLMRLSILGDADADDTELFKYIPSPADIIMANPAESLKEKIINTKQRLDEITSPKQETAASWPVISLQDPPYFVPMQHHYYRFYINMLGMRAYPNFEDDGDMKLVVSSFWEDSNAPVIAVPGEDFPGPNFTRPALIQSSNVGVGLGAVQDLLSRGEQVNDTFGPVVFGLGSKVGVNVGIRVTSPIFKTPYLPYLQNVQMSAPRANDDGGRLMKKSFDQVVLPDLNFSLKGRQSEELGTLSISLQSYTKVPQGIRTAKLQAKSPQLSSLSHIVEKFEKIDPSLDPSKKNKYSRLPVDSRSSCQVFVDVFACTTGKLAYDDDCVVGRAMIDHEILQLQTSRDEYVIQTFNADDFFLGWSEKGSLPFVPPALRAANLDYAGPTPDEWIIMRDVMYSTFHSSKGGNQPNCCTCCGCFGCYGCYCGCRNKFTNSCVNTCNCCCNCDEPPDLPPEKAESEGSEVFEEQNSSLLDFKNPENNAETPVEKSPTATPYVDWNETNDSLRCALTTWIRPVGHLVRFDPVEFSGSRIVARLQMMKTATEEEEKKTGRTHIGTFNIVTIASSVEGTIVWRSPRLSDECSKLFFVPGEPVCVLQGTSDRRYYSFVIPSFDIRNSEENQFFCLNTLFQAFSSIDDRAFAQEMSRYNRAIGTAQKKKDKDKISEVREEIRVQLEHLHSRQLYLMGDDLDILFPILKGDTQGKKGYLDPVKVGQGQFLCRFKKTGSALLDRPQTSSWFDAVGLLPTFNFYHDLVYGESSDLQAQLRGIIRVEKIQAIDATATLTPEESKEIEIEKIGTAEVFSKRPPVMSPSPSFLKWKVETVVVHIFILNALNLENGDALGKSDPYLKVTCGKYEESSVTWHKDTLDPIFFEHFIFHCIFPGFPFLEITVMDKAEILGKELGEAKDTEIGSLRIDLEERWLALLHQEETKDEMSSLAEVTIRDKQKICLPPAVPFPIELKSITKIEESESYINAGDSFGATTGFLRYVIDMHREGEPYEPLSVEKMGVKENFELRMTIWGVSDVWVFKDAGQRNDLMCEVKIQVSNVSLEKREYTFKTDVHMYANNEANWNWKVILPLTLPTAGITCTFSLIDVDAKVPDEPVYVSEKIFLDDFAVVQLARIKMEDPLIKPMDYIVEFNEPLLDTTYEGNFRGGCCAPFEACGCPRSCTRCGCNPCVEALEMEDIEDEDLPRICPGCTCNERLPQPRQHRFTTTAAKLSLQIAMLSEAEAKMQPSGGGRDAPNPMPEPRGRMAPGMMFRDPIGYAKIIFGPQRCAVISISMAVIGGLLVLCFLTFIVAQIIIAARLAT
eukprot:GHVP01058499.1.p1 GENE.GHVP01058499.1~~GHVP01058499.1.p1  ORF type:complete len:2632 (+),score=491.44 GHVP01058499.1:40-7935(+)